MPPRMIRRSGAPVAPVQAAPRLSRITRTTAPASNHKASEQAKHVAAIKTAFLELDTVDAQLAQLVWRKTELEVSIRENLTASGLPSVTDGSFEAMVKETRSNASRTINAKRFYDLLAERSEKDEQAAWDAMSVTTKEAEKLLTKVELNKNFPATPGKVTGTKVVIERVNVKLS